MVKMLYRGGWLVAGLLALFVIAAVTGVVGGGPLDPEDPPAPTLPLVEPRIPISQPDSPAGFPIVINEPGSYYLIEDIVGVAGQHGIRLSAVAGVTIDLNGFSLRGISGSLDGISSVSEVEDVVVKDGLIYSWGQDGIDLDSAHTIRIDGVEAHFNQGRGIVAGFRTLLTNCLVTAGNQGPRTVAIDLDPSSILSNCSTFGYAVGIATSNDSMVKDCIVTGASSIGIKAATGASVSGCSVADVNLPNDPVVSAVGIEAGEDTRISGNSVDDVICSLPCFPVGISVIGAGARVDDNTISDVSRAILSTGGATIFGNTVSGIALGPPIVGVGSDDIGPITTADDPNASPWANIAY